MDGYPAHPMKTYKKYIKPYKVKQRNPGEVSFIIEEMMDRGIAKGDITHSDGIGTDNMTCIIIDFIDENQNAVVPQSIQLDDDKTTEAIDEKTEAIDES